jgi:predicted  nucleic acid-binding Zn-ribbon protein
VERDLINAKTNHEYKELLKVKAQYEKEIIDTEDKILKLMEEIEELEEEKEKLEQLLQNEVKEIDEKIKEKERELQETKENIKKIDQEKEEFKKNVDNNLLRRYEMIKKRVKNGIVIAAVDDNICSGCFMMIPPKLLNDLIKNKDKDKLYQCPNCGRFLYYKE